MGNKLKILSKSPSPKIMFLSVDPIEREYQYENFKDEYGYDIKDYNDICTKMYYTNPKHFIVIMSDWVTIFRYKGITHTISIKPGVVLDGASIPFSFGEVSRLNQYTLESTIVHDILMKLAKDSLRDINDIFYGLLDSSKVKVGILTEWIYKLGVRFPAAKRAYENHTIHAGWWGDTLIYTREKM